MTNLTPTLALPQLPAMQQLADARRVLGIDCDRLQPFLTPEDRRSIREAKRIAWAALADVAETLVETLNIAAGDPDLEDATDAEDEGLTPFALCHARGGPGPGCVVADAGEETHDREGIDDDREGVDEREPEEGI